MDHTAFDEIPAPEAVREPQSPGKSILSEVVETILFTVLIFLAVRVVVQNFKVEGASMEPNLHEGQYLLVNKLAYLDVDLNQLRQRLPLLPDSLLGSKDHLVLQEPQRGDVIVFRFPRDPKRDFIKRVIGLPGETIEVRNGKIFVNGLELQEPYIREQPRYSLPPQKVPPDNYFVLGDNRNYSSDSHVWGVVPKDELLGKAWLVYWPLDEWGIAPNFPVAAAPPSTP